MEDKSFLASINESSTDNDSDNVSLITNTCENICYGNYVHPDINARDARLKVRERIRQAQSEWKEVYLSEKRIRKGFHKLFKAILNK